MNYSHKIMHCEDTMSAQNKECAVTLFLIAENCDCYAECCKNRRHIFQEFILPGFLPTQHCDSSHKVKLSHYRHAGDKGERRHSSYSFLTTALYGGSGQMLSVTPWMHFTPGTKTLVPTGQEAGWASRACQDTEARENILFLCQGSDPSRPVV
jgi:hypothetical protein